MVYIAYDLPLKMYNYEVQLGQLNILKVQILIVFIIQSYYIV